MVTNLVLHQPWFPCSCKCFNVCIAHQIGIYCQICFFVGYVAVETSISHERTTLAVSANTWLQLSQAWMATRCPAHQCQRELICFSSIVLAFYGLIATFSSFSLSSKSQAGKPSSTFVHTPTKSVWQYTFAKWWTRQAAHLECMAVYMQVEGGKQIFQRRSAHYLPSSSHLCLTVFWISKVSPKQQLELRMKTVAL